MKPIEPGCVCIIVASPTVLRQNVAVRDLIEDQRARDDMNERLRASVAKAGERPHA